MNEKQVILDFLKWYEKDYKALPNQTPLKGDVALYIESKQPKVEDYWRGGPIYNCAFFDFSNTTFEE